MYYVFIFALFFSLPSFATQQKKVQIEASTMHSAYLEVITTVRKDCQVPDKMSLYASSGLEAFVGQYFGFSSSSMLTTAFLRSFTNLDPGLHSVVYCVAYMVNIPLDPYWEKNLDLWSLILKYSNPLPSRRYMGFDERGVVWIEL